MDLSKMTNYALVLMSTCDPDGDMRKHTINELARRLEIAEAKAATYWAECEAWRGRSLGQSLDRNAYFRVLLNAMAATDAALEVKHE